MTHYLDEPLRLMRLSAQAQEKRTMAMVDNELSALRKGQRAASERIRQLEADRNEWEALWKKASIAVIDLQDKVRQQDAAILERDSTIARLEAGQSATASLDRWRHE